MKRILILLFALIITIGFAGCVNQKNNVPQAIVSLKTIQQEQIIETINSTGRVSSQYYVDVVARVDGYLEKKYFNEGDIVKKGELLFLIEPYTYVAKVNEAAANLRNSQAAYRDSSKNLIRAEQLVKSDYISKADYDNKLAIRDKDKATVDANRAALTQAQINLGYTQIRSPINGKIGKMDTTAGNYITPSFGKLATIVSLDPMQVLFSLKSKDYLTLKKASKVDNLSDISVEIRLADNSVYPKKGKIEFINNIVDESSGTIQLRALFENKNNLLVPGDYVDAKIILNNPRSVILVPQEAVLQTDEGKYLYVIDENKIAHRRDIVAEEDYKGNWIVTEGLQIGENIALTGLQYIQDDKQVTVVQPKQKNSNMQQQQVKKQSFFVKLKRFIKKVIGK